MVVGCGHLGSRMASHLSEAGHEVVVVDRDAAAFEHLSPDFSGYRIQGDAMDTEVLGSAKLGEATLAVLATDDDNLNLVLGLRARVVHEVGRVVVRVGDPVKKSLFVGGDLEVICPNDLLGQLLVRRVLGAAEAP